MSFDPVGIAASVGKALVGPCLNYTKKEINFIIDYDSNMKRVNLLHRDLEDKKEEVLAYLEEGERQGRKAAPTVKHWLENELPEFTNTMDQKLLMDEEGLMKAGRCCFGRCLNPFSRHHLSKKAVEKADEMNSLITKMNDHGGVFSVTLPAPPPLLSSLSGSHNYVRLKSRENKMTDILKHLKDGINRIGIWGTGGAGKSMFVEELARRVEQENLFPKVVIAEISEFPDIRMIQDQIAERIGFTDLAQYHNNQERAIRLGNRIKELILQEEDKIQSEVKEKKKLLLILDNIWKKLDLGSIGIPHEFLTNEGCSLILTSRREDVCHKMDATNYIIEMGTLNGEDAKDLFREKIGKIAYTEEYDKIITEILDGCSRLPISIIILADRLKTQSLRTWRTTTEDIKKSIRGDKRIFTETYSVIKMSYDLLEDNEAKIFFRLCCLFPSQSYVHIHDLLRYSIGLGLLEHISSLSETIQQVFNLAKELTSLSLLSEIDEDKGVVRIHDDVREAGISFATEGKDVFHVGSIPKRLNKDSYKKYTVFSVVSDSSYEYLSGEELTDLTLLHIVGIDGSKLCDDYFRGMKFLKVLHLSKFDMETLPTSIRHLENLQTLLLEYCSLGDMSIISQLSKLQVLSLKGSRFSALPKEISCLVRLKMLDLTNCIWLNRIPSSLLVKLNLLEGLYMKNSFSNWQTTGNSACLSELESMHDLQVLEIEINCMEQLPARDLPFKDVSSYMIHVAVSKPWNKNLWSSSKDLQVNGLHFGDLVKHGFKHFVSQAETLFLDNIQDLKNLAPHVDKYGLRRLKQLRVANCLTMESMVSMTAVHQMVEFPELQVLHLDHLAQFIAICHRETPPNTFSNLQKVTLSHLDRLTDCALFAQHATKLEVLNVKSCKNLEYVFLSLFEDREGSQENFKLDFLKELHLEDLPRLIGLWHEMKIESCSSPDLQSESDSPRFYHFCDGDNDIDNAARKNILFPNKGIFPCLEHLHLKMVSSIEGLWDIRTSRQFSTMLPTLRTLRLIRMDKLKHVWSKELCKGKHNFESFKEIKIQDCGSLESIFSPLVDESTSLMDIKFEQLQTMEMEYLDSFRYFLKGNVNLDFPSLKELRLIELYVIKAFVEVEDPEASMFIDTVLFTKKVMFRRLEKLVLEGLYSIMELWDSTMVEEFSNVLPNMQSLFIWNIKKLRYVWRSNEISRESRNNNMIINIKELRVKACSSLESLIHVDAVGGSMELPCLEILNLSELDEFRCLMEKEERSEFPALKRLFLSNLEKMKTLIVNHGSSEGVLFDGEVKFPALEELYLLKVTIKQLWAFKTGEEFSNIFSSLQTLYLDEMYKLRYIWSMVLWGGSHSFRSLKEIRIFQCSSLESLFPPIPPANNLVPVRLKFPQLQRLKLIDLPDFKCLLQGNVELESSALREVELRRLPRLITLVVDKLQCTKTPERGCDLLLPTPLFNQKLLLPGLEKLTIQALPNVETLWVITSCEEFNSKYPNLQSLVVYQMIKLKQIWFNGASECDNENRLDFNFASLEIMRIMNCGHLVSLISPAVVTSYNQQPQSQSPKMASFPKLQELHLSELSSFRSPFTRNSDMDFQALKKMTVADLPFNILLKLEKSDSEGGASKEEIQRKEKALKIEEAEEEIALFNNIRFPSLEQLAIIDFKFCNKKEENDHDDDNNNSSSSLLPKLKHLVIQGVERKHFPGAIVRKGILSLTLINFSGLKYLVSPAAAADASTHNEAVFTSPSELQKLEELTILCSYSLVDLFAVTVEDLRPLTNLKKLKLDFLLEFKRVPWELLPNLQSLDINCSLNNADFLFPADSLSEGSSLQLLESMEIRDCGNMQSIIKDDQEQHFKHQKDGQIVFPKLKEIELHNLSLLCTFNSSSYRIHFPSLVKFTMINVPKLTSFSSGPVVNPELIKVAFSSTKETTVDAEDLNTIVQRHIQKGD